MTRLSLAAVTALTALVAAPPAGAAAPREERPLRNVDVRTADGGPVPATQWRARASLERALGDEGVVSTDRVSGGARRVARTDGFLTPRRRASAADVALDYVRAHPDVFGLDASDLGRLRLERRYRTPDGVTHLAYTQTYGGVRAYDNVLLANVDDAGRLLNVGGAAVSDLRVPSLAPDLDAEAALAAAAREVGGSLVPPRARQGRGPERPTRFSNGDAARLALFNDGQTTRLAWVLGVTGEHDYAYEIVLDATSGRVLKRRSLTEFAFTARVFDDVPGGTPVTVDLRGPDLTWLTRYNQPPGNPKLSGENVHAYVDADATDGLSLPTAGGDLEVPPSSGTDWLYDLQPFSVPGQGCLPLGCSWNPTIPGSRVTNRNQSTTQLFWFVNTFHDHLAAAPISFTPASGNFEGDDPVQAETDNFLNPPVAGTSSTENASMTTRPDGTPPRLQAFLFNNPARNSADTADVVYHEYTHGLTNRSVGSGVGLDANQSRAMGEGWSDWYALDFLEAQGLRPDGPARGEMRIGEYLDAGGFRTQGADCPVAPSAGCRPRGGYTLGDMGHIDPSGFEVHADGEIWLETLWDLRAALGAVEVERVITSGLRLAPNNPSFLEARDAILQSASTVAQRETMWTVFAARGMGYSATTTSSAATTANEAFDLPPQLVHESTTVSDAGPPPPLNDGDDTPEPGETISVTERLSNPHAATTAALGELTTTAPGVTIPPLTAVWPAMAAGQSATNSPPFEVTLPVTASCDSSVQLNLAMTPTPGASFDIPLQLPVGSKPSADPFKTITPTTGITSTVTFNGAPGKGPVHDLEVRISKLQHTWVGDLVMTLTSPAGKIVTLMSRPGTGAEGASGDDLSDLVLDDDAATPIDGIPATNPPGGYTGRFRPDGRLSDFDDQDRSGTWTLTVIDAFPGDDSGTLYGWGIRPSGLAPCPNRAPFAVDNAYSVAGGRALRAASVLANDSDPDGDALSAVKASDPAHGTVALAADGSFTYMSQPGFSGSDSFTYRTRDSHALASTTATVSISVGNTPPTATDDTYKTTRGTALTGATVLANDGDANGDALTALPASGPAHGTLALAPNGTFTYTPEAGFTGRDAFTYTASDGAESSAPASATITVTEQPVTPPPSPPPALAPAKLQVLRAGVASGRLDVLAAITAKAAGKVRVTYRSAGATTAFDAAISGGRIRFRKALPRSQRSKPTGIVTLTYRGSALVEPDGVTLRAARGKARLLRTSSRIDAKGRLGVTGTVSPRVRGVVRVRLSYAAAGGVSASLDYRAKIARGRWSLNQRLPAAAAAAGGLLSIQFTGYEPLGIRGEQIAKEVKAGG
jgi:subtilisin-like proprotein convertase family protein